MLHWTHAQLQLATGIVKARASICILYAYYNLAVFPFPMLHSVLP